MMDLKDLKGLLSWNLFISVRKTNFLEIPIAKYRLAHPSPSTLALISVRGSWNPACSPAKLN